MGDVSRFERLGGEAGVQSLVDAFYDAMENEPQFAELRNMHPRDLTDSRAKLFAFLCGYTGGPNLYLDRYGYRNLKVAHRPFPIGPDQVASWLNCMNLAMERERSPREVRASLASAFRGTASAVANKS